VIVIFALSLTSSVLTIKRSHKPMPAARVVPEPIAAVIARAFCGRPQRCLFKEHTSKMLPQAEEPPSTVVGITTRGATAPIVALVQNQTVPRHYLAIEAIASTPSPSTPKSVFEYYVGQIAAPLSDYTFANNIIWLSQKSAFYQIVEECFCLFSLNGLLPSPCCLPPLGKSENQFARARQPASRSWIATDPSSVY